MPIGKQEKGKRIALVALAAISAWLVYRNLVMPAQQSLPASLPAAGASGSQSDASRQQEGGLRPGSPRAAQPGKEAGRRGRAMDQQELAALDPTLRLDLLEKVRELKYEGNSRNIFQFYTPPPPPKPVTNPILPPAIKPSQPASSSPPPVNIPLKFYGVSSRPGSPEKKAFLTEGDNIYVGQEGDVIAKNYKISRIGVNSIELEDIGTKQKHQLTLIVE